jgi:DNA-binding transcriptional LysR family regulator
MVAFSRFARYFDELAQRGSLRKAAEHLNVAPSAIDRLLLNAEEELGTRLFERRATGLRLTAAGELLIHGLRTWRRDYQRVLSQIDDLKGLRRGNVSIAVVEGAIQDLVPDVLASFYKKYPTITCEIRVMPGEAIEQMVARGDADVGLMFNPSNNSGLKIEYSVAYRMGALLPPNHPLTSMGTLRLSDLAGFPVIIPDESTSLRRVVDQALKKSGVTLRPVAVVSQTSLIRTLVLRGVGIGLLSKIGALLEIKEGTIVFRELTDSSIRGSTMCVVTASGRHLPIPASLVVQEFAALMVPPDHGT